MVISLSCVSFISLFYFHPHLFNMNNESQYQYKLYVDIIPNDILQYMFIKQYLSPKLNIMWKNIPSLNKAILKIPNNPIKKASSIYKRRNIDDDVLCRKRI